MEEKRVMRLSRYEMETTVNFNAEESKAVLYTRDKAVMRRLDKLVAEFPEIYVCICETDIDKTYEFPKKYAIPKRPRILSKEQREAARERFSKHRGRMDDNDELEDDIPEDDEMEES